MARKFSFTIELDFDGIWGNNSTVEDEGTTVELAKVAYSDRYISVMEEWYPDISFDVVWDDEVMTPYERLNPGVGRDNDEVRELYPEIDDEIGRAWEYIHQHWDEIVID